MKIHMGGKKFCFNNLAPTEQAKVKDMLASKDPVMAAGLRGELPGLKINGQVVTKDNIDSFVTPVKQLDLNRDGVVDNKDISLAGKVLAESKKLEPKVEAVIEVPKKESITSKVKKAVSKAVKKKK